MRKILFLAAIVCLLVTANQVSAQFIVHPNGNAEVGEDCFGSVGRVLATSPSVSLTDVDPNSTVMVYQHNRIPYIAPLVIQNTDLDQSQYVIAGEVLAGRNVDSSRTNGEVTVKDGTEYEIEAASEVTLAGGFTVEKGAAFAILPASF